MSRRFSLLILARFLLLLFTMVLNDASGSGPHDGMPAGNVPDHAAHGGALQAAFGANHARQNRKASGANNSRNECAHGIIPQSVQLAITQ
jgi:hypothetical protein